MDELMRLKPPHSADVEQEVLAAVLVNDDAVPFAASMLTPEDFYLIRHRVVYEAAVAVFKEHGAVDLVLLEERLKVAGKLEAAGGLAGVARLLDRKGYSQHLERYAEVLKAKTLQRRLIDIGAEVELLAREDDLTSTERLQRVDHMVRGLYNDADTGGLEHVSQAVERHRRMVARAEDSGGVVGLRTGIHALDDKIGGLRPGWMVMVMAPTAGGKTAFSLNNLCYEVLKAGGSAMMFAVEMEEDQVAGRLISRYTGISYERQTQGNMTAEDRADFDEACDLVSGVDLYIDEDSTISIDQLCMRARARAHKMGKSPDLIVVDYIQLLIQERAGGRVTEASELAHISRSLKRLANSLKTVVVSVTQPTQSAQRAANNGERYLTVADAKGAQALSADVDLALMINKRDDDTADGGHHIRIEAGKFRHGPTFYITERDVRWHGETMSYQNPTYRSYGAVY